MKMAVFWDVASCIPVHIGDVSDKLTSYSISLRLSHYRDDGGIKLLLNVGQYPPDYTPHLTSQSYL
jgi:hypothetical protein